MDDWATYLDSEPGEAIPPAWQQAITKSDHRPRTRASAVRTDSKIGAAHLN